MEAAGIYARGICNKHMAIVYGAPESVVKNKQLDYVECSFFDYSFFHFTGLDYHRGWTGSKKKRVVIKQSDFIWTIYILWNWPEGQSGIWKPSLFHMPEQR